MGFPKAHRGTHAHVYFAARTATILLPNALPQSGKRRDVEDHGAAKGPIVWTYSGQTGIDRYGLYRITKPLLYR
jgi:hypothetical protein